MTPADVLLALVEAEIVLWAEGDRLRFRAPVGALTDALRRDVDGCRGALFVLVRAGAVLPVDRGAWPEDAIENFEERSGICEFDGGLSRRAAEREAEKRMRLAHAQAWLDHSALRCSP